MRPTHRAARVALLSLAFAAASVVGAPPIGGCAGDTTGRRVTLDVRAVVSPESRSFTNAAGWRITIERALLATGALYFYDGAAVLASSRRPALLALRPAHAHPGHYVAGEARGELLAPSSVDLLAGALLGTGTGVSGPIRSATFSFALPPAGPLAGELGESVAVVEGTGERGAETRVFRAELSADDVRDARGALHIDGCLFVEADVQRDGSVTVAVRLSRWFDQVDLDLVPASADGAPVLMKEGLARNQLVRGAKQGVSYVFSYAPGRASEAR